MQSSPTRNVEVVKCMTGIKAWYSRKTQDPRRNWMPLNNHLAEIMAPYFPIVSFQKWVLANTRAKWTPRSCLPDLLLSKLRLEEKESVVIYFFRGIMHFFTSNEDVRQPRLVKCFVKHLCLLRLFRSHYFFVCSWKIQDPWSETNVRLYCRN